MPKYRCTNKECSLYDKEVTKSTKLRYVDYEVYDSAQICEECGKVGESIKEEIPCTTFHGNNVCNK